MADHVKRVTNNKTHINNLRKKIQNVIIDILASRIRNSILTDLSQTTFYSIIVDCMSNVSHIKRMTLVIRFVKCQTSKKSEIREHFVGFLSVVDTSR